MIPRPIGFMSPRIACLEEDYKSKGEQAIFDFWGEVARMGAPLIEASPRPGHSLATFLWKADVPVSHVVIISELMHGWWWNNYSDSRLIRLADSNVYYKTFLVPSNLRCLYKLAPDMPLIHPTEVEDLGAFLLNAIADPLNPISETDWTRRSVFRLPNAPDDLWAQPKPEVYKGYLLDCPQRFQGLSASQRAKIYLPNETYSGGTIERLLVCFDLDAYINDIRVPVIVDNLLADRQIPPTAILFIDPSDDRATSLNCSADVAMTIAHEVVPWLRATYGLSDDPGSTVIGGGSLGGLMALYVGLMHSNVFGVVISQSGGFMYGPDRPIGPSDWDDALADSAGAEWLIQQVAVSDAAPIRVSLDVGTLEIKRDGTFMNALVTNRHMRTVLKLKGYKLRYHEFCGGHQYIEHRSAFSSALQWALMRAE